MDLRLGLFENNYKMIISLNEIIIYKCNIYLNKLINIFLIN